MQFQKQSWAGGSKLPLGSLLIALVLLLNLLAAAPSLHELFHADAGQAHHHCAVTLFAHGQVDAADASVGAVVPTVTIEFSPSSPVSILSTAVEYLPPGRAPPSALCNY